MSAVVTFDGADLPDAWFVGDFSLQLVELTSGRWDPDRQILVGAAGQALLLLPCARPPIHTKALLDEPEVSELTHAVEVVEVVRHPQTEVGLAEAQRLRPGAQVGDTIPLDLTVGRLDVQNIIDLGRGVQDWLDTHPTGFPVEFTDLTVSFDHVGIVTDGSLFYPVGDRRRGPIEILIEGFTLVLSALELTPFRSTAVAQVQLPAGLTDTASCRPATIDLGVITMSPTCDFYLDAPGQAYGPWLLGDTGLVIEGTGFVLDLSRTGSPPPWAPTWRGLVLGTGTATGETTVPDPCNTGYLRGHYAFSGAVVVSSGFFGSLHLEAPVSFTAINPFGQAFGFDAGDLDVQTSEITGGELRDGWTELPVKAVCEGLPGQVVKTPVISVSVQPDLDLAGVIDHGNREISWGELTRPGDEVVVWRCVFGPGYLFLPAGAFATYSSVATGAFAGLPVSTQPDPSLAALDSDHVAGVTFLPGVRGLVFSTDRPGARGNPIKLARLQGWIHVGITGVDGVLSTSFRPTEPLGDPNGVGYEGNQPFVCTLFTDEKPSLLAEFVTSASFDSNFAGRLAIPVPSAIPALSFTNMKLTSTACLVGGDVVLPTTGVTLGYWDLALVPTSGPPPVLSVRTGRVLLTGCGLDEPAHFEKPFGFIWAEMLADGNLGRLFFDYNTWGQRFDGLVFNAEELILSPYAPAITDPYLGVYGSVCLKFFGQHEVNIRDARGPGHTRQVSVPKTAVTPHAGPTDLALAGTWHDVLSRDLAVFDCLDVNVDYNVAAQNGFLGTGGAVFGFLHSISLEITVEINSLATDIHISSQVTHDLDLGLPTRIGGIDQISGCARIEGTTLSLITLYGTLEASAAVGPMLGPKAGFETEVDLAVTATTVDLYVSGDLLLSVAGVDIEASATAHLFFDLITATAEGELYGRVDCDAAVVGLSGEGQLTWHVSPAMHYLQGRLKVELMSAVGGSLEGGLFLGTNVPKELAWVLDPSDTHFGMSRNILPSTLTGVFGYGQIEFNVNLGIFGGGVALYAGAGAFATPLPGAPVVPFVGGPMLPYVVGTCGIYLHGEILGGLVSASAWANLSLRGPAPTYFEGTVGLRGCVLWVLCAQVSLTGGLDSTGFYLRA